MGKRKCVICSKPIEPNDQSVPYKNRYAHADCFNSAMKLIVSEKKETANKVTKERQRKISKTIDKPVTEKESIEKKELIAYIKQLTGADIDARTYSLIKKYRKDFPYFTYKGIQQTLEYYFVIKQNNKENHNIIGIVPYIYDEAASYFRKLQETTLFNELQTKKLSDLYQTKKVKIIPPKTTTKQIDISKIGET